MAQEDGVVKRDPYGSESLHRGRTGELYVAFVRAAFGYTDDAENWLCGANPATVRAIKRGLARVVGAELRKAGGA